MRRSGLSRALAVPAALGALVWAVLPAAAQPLTCRNGKCERIIYGASPSGQRLRVNAHGPVILEAGVSRDLSYVIRVSVNARTGGGGVRIGTGRGPVTAISGGGEIVVEKSGGVVTLRNMAGPVNVGSAAGVRCDSGSGGIRLTNIAGPMRVATSMGSISASLLGSRISDSYLATGNGDITVLIPSNVGVTIQAQNTMADTLRRIVSD